MYTLGVTGSIGAGKTTVARHIAGRDYPLLIADDLAKEILQSNRTVQGRLADHFGPQILDDEGFVRKQALATAGFANPAEQAFLNSVLHPLVEDEMMRQIQSAARDRIPLLIMDIPLLFEVGLASRFSGTLVVTADQETRYQRVYGRSGMSREDFMRRDGLQLPQAEKVARADFVIENVGGMAELSQAAEELRRRILTG